MLSEDVFLKIGSISLYTLGVALALGFLTATIAAIPEARRRGMRRRVVLDLMLLLMLTTVLSSRITAVIVHWDVYAGAPWRALSVPSDGLSYYGGLVAALIVVALFAFRHELRFWPVADALTPAAALGISAGLAVALSTNMLHLPQSGVPWLSLTLFTLAYMGTYAIWRWRHRVRFEGELTLLYLGLDSLVRILIGYGWVLGNGPYSSVRGPLITLGMVATLWFARLGAAYRKHGVPPRGQHRGRASRPPAWVVGYAVLIGLILVRNGMSG